MEVIVLLAIVFALLWAQRRIYRQRWNEGLEFEIHFSSGAAFEGDTVTVTERLTNRKRLPLPYVTTQYNLSHQMAYLDRNGREMRVGEQRQALYVIGSHRTLLRESTAICHHRGVYPVSDVEVASANPLFTNRMRMKMPTRASITVYPKRTDISEDMVPYRKITGDLLARRFINPDPFEFRGIREYQPYDSFRQINFRATAKTGELMSNIHGYTVSQEMVLLLNLQPYNLYQREYVQEEAIRLAAFLCKQFLADGIPVELYCPSPSVVTGEPIHVHSGTSKAHLEKLYTGLAHIDLTQEAPPLMDAMHSMTPRHSSGLDRAYILISAYHGKDMLDEYMRLQKLGLYVKWILPRSEYDDPLPMDLDDGMYPYEVKHHAG